MSCKLVLAAVAILCYDPLILLLPRLGCTLVRDMGCFAETHGLFVGFPLQDICSISLCDHAPIVDGTAILTACNPFCVDSQLQSKRLRWLGHVKSMSMSAREVRLSSTSHGLSL